ncbi:MAG: hypothetical protein ACTSUF_00750 [Candidatus Heimdallarchaeaceae archaeon]
MSKAVGWYVIFIIFVIGMFVGSMLIIFWKYLSEQNIQASKEACTLKLTNYCYRWLTEKKEPGDWDQVNPQGCEQFNITKPDEDQCKNLMAPYGLT